MSIVYSSPVPYEGIDLSWMIGRRIIGVSFYEPEAWDFIFDPKCGIGVECLWRIVEDGKVVLTSEDRGHQFGLPAPVDASAKATTLLSEQSITAVQLREATTDIVIELTGGLRLEIIPTSSGYESWQLRDPFGFSYVAQGGGQICRWKP